MSRTEAEALIARYYAAFNAGDAGGMLDCVAENVEHRVNEGGVRRGRTLFAEFCSHMGVSYREELKDLVIFANADGTRGAAEFVVHGEYLQTDPGLPEAKGQRYILPAGGFFDIRGGKIARVTTFYNLNDWIAQVSA
ncbi:MAG: nuclear transport factor 2 family protein [Fuscovulum sp.]|nr:MAG: nuclear transport factor 2 family protein [Fuscovulum sp.]